VHRLTVRAETPADVPTIRALLVSAFPDASEARLVDALRDTGDLILSLVAARAVNVVGCAQFSRMNAPIKALALGPVAVAAEERRRGIAAMLIREGLDRARHAGWKAIFCLGDPLYYSRFGFSIELATGFSSPYAGPHFMVLPLDPAGLPSASGAVHYAPAFADL